MVIHSSCKVFCLRSNQKERKKKKNHNFVFHEVCVNEFIYIKLTAIIYKQRDKVLYSFSV